MFVGSGRKKGGAAVGGASDHHAVGVETEFRRDLGQQRAERRAWRDDLGEELTAGAETVQPVGPDPVHRVPAEFERVIVVADAEPPGESGGEPVGLVERVPGHRVLVLHHQQAGQRRGCAMGAALGRGQLTDPGGERGGAGVVVHAGGAEREAGIVAQQQRAGSAVDRQRADLAATAPGNLGERTEGGLAPYGRLLEAPAVLVSSGAAIAREALATTAPAASIATARAPEVPRSSPTYSAITRSGRHGRERPDRPSRLRRWPARRGSDGDRAWCAAPARRPR